MHSFLVGRSGPRWIVETPDGVHHVLAAVNVVTGVDASYVGMRGVVVVFGGEPGLYRRFYSQFSSGASDSALGLFHGQ